MFDVHSLFDPLGWDDFKSDLFERKYYHINRKDPRFYEDLLTIDQVDEVLFSQKVSHPSFRVIDSKTSTYPDPREYTRNGTSAIDPIEFVGQYSKGGTLAMAGMHHYIHSLRQFCNHLQTLLGHPTQTNLYLTPKASKGFDPHYDSHDVVVLQIYGKKSWNIYESDLILPDKSMPFEKDGFTPGIMIDELTLEAGDLLYIPRGVVHDAYTTDEPSLHITLGILGFTWSQYLIESIIHLAGKDPDFRHFVSANLGAKDFDEHVSSLLEKLRAEAESRQGFDRFVDQLRNETPSDRVGHLVQVMESNNLEMRDTIKPLLAHASIVTRNGSIELLTGSKKIMFPNHCREACRYLVQRSEQAVVIEDIPGVLDSDGKLVLVRRLISEGLAAIDR